MITTRRNFVRTASVLAIANVAHGANLPLQQDIPIQSGPFSAEGSFGSAKCPDWFRDAKFGIWAHWGPQSAAGSMETGTPATCTWRAVAVRSTMSRRTATRRSSASRTSIPHLEGREVRSRPALMSLYKKAARARYFVSMGVHHDNFDLWNFQAERLERRSRWVRRRTSSVLFRQAALKEGLKFGVSEHLCRQLSLVPDQPRRGQRRANSKTSPMMAPIPKYDLASTMKPTTPGPAMLGIPPECPKATNGSEHYFLAD